MFRLLRYVARFICATLGLVARPKFQVALVLIILAILIGTVFYVNVEGLETIDAVYFTVMTLTTVGYGDIVPSTDAGKIFTIFYSILGIGVLFAFIAATTQYIHKNGALKQPQCRTFFKWKKKKKKKKKKK
ncbi:potassium channel family protein [Patescibacteria group bacterium]